MDGEMLTFALLTLSSLVIIVNPLGATIIYVSLTANLDQARKEGIARDSCRFSLFVLLLVAVLGASVLQLFGISLEAFRIAGGILLFGIGMEMVYAKTSRTKLTATERYESRETDDIALMPIAIPMIAGPGAITATIVLMNEAGAMGMAAYGTVVAAVVLSIAVTYGMMKHADSIISRVGQREYRAVNRLMGMLLIAIAVQFVINGMKIAFPVLTGGA